jgi:multidrug efflux pump subunit AcrA (membrane-fusion protein)
MKLAAVLFILFILTACGAQPPLGHSQGPDLVTPVVGRTASAFVERGTVADVYLLPGMVRVESVPLFFEMSGMQFDTFHVYPGDTVHEGQLLATLYTPREREQLANQQAHIARLHRAHALAAEVWEIDYELMNLRYIAQLRNAAETLSEAAMAEAQRLYLEMDRARLTRAQEAEWQSVERADANARLLEIRENLRGTELLAPFDGLITYIPMLPHGTPVDTNLRILYISPANAPQIVEHTGDTPPSRMRIERIIGEINGQPVDLTYMPTTQMEAAYNTLHNLPRRTRFALPEGSDFPPGAPVRIFFYITYIPDTLRIPASTLVGRGAGAYVYRREDGHWIPVTPTFGARTPTFVEVLYGLQEGDELLVN